MTFGEDFTDFQKVCDLGKTILRLVPQGIPRGGDPLTHEQIVSVVRSLAVQRLSLAVEGIQNLSSTYGINAVLQGFSPTLNAQAGLAAAEVGSGLAGEPVAGENLDRQLGQAQ